MTEKLSWIFVLEAGNSFKFKELVHITVENLKEMLTSYRI